MNSRDPSEVDLFCCLLPDVLPICKLHSHTSCSCATNIPTLYWNSTDTQEDYEVDSTRLFVVDKYDIIGVSEYDSLIRITSVYQLPIDSFCSSSSSQHNHPGFQCRPAFSMLW